MHQDTLLIACALKQECSHLRRSLSLEAGGGVRLRRTGMGPRRAARRTTAILQEEKPRLLVFTGTAGGLDPALKMGQVVLPRVWRLQDGPSFENDARLLSMPVSGLAPPVSKGEDSRPEPGSAGRQTAAAQQPATAPCDSEDDPPAELLGILTSAELGLTVRRPVLRPSVRRRLHLETGASICDMESAAALQSAAALDIPAVALKVVSDTGLSGITDFWKHFEANLDRLAQALHVLLGRCR